MPRLIVKEEGQERVVELRDAQITIGRSTENLVCISDKKASRKHCQIERIGQGYKLVDLESRNGTRVNEQVVNQKLLASGDVIRIGDVTITFEDTPATRQSTVIVPREKKEEAKIEVKLAEPEPPQAAALPQAEPAASPSPVIAPPVKKPITVHKVTTAGGPPARYNVEALRQQREEQRTIQAFAIGVGVFFFVIVLLIVINMVTAEPVELRQTKDLISRARAKMEQANSEPDAKSAVAHLKAASELLQKVPQKYEQQYKEAQELLSAVNEERSKKEPLLHANEMQELVDLENRAGKIRQPADIDKVLQDIDDFRRRYPEMLAEAQQRLAALEMGLKERKAATKERDFKEGMEYVDRRVEQQDFRNAIIELERLLNRFKGDVQLYQQVVAKKDGVMEKVSAYRKERFALADEKVKQGKNAEAKQILRDLLIAFGDGSVSALKHHCDIIAQKLGTIPQ